jgi:hypothetical protein
MECAKRHFLNRPPYEGLELQSALNRFNEKSRSPRELHHEKTPLAADPED